MRGAMLRETVLPIDASSLHHHLRACDVEVTAQVLSISS